MKRILTVLLCVLFAGLPIFGQEDQGDDGQAQEDVTGQRIEDLYLSQDLEIQILRSQAMADDRESKQLALRDIGEMVENGLITGNNDSVYVILESLASEGVSRQIRESGKVVNDYPMVRREAVELLGKVGGEQAKEALIGVLKDDPEPTVLAEAAYALGTIGLNENNEVSDQLVAILLRENARVTPDNNLAYSAILSLEKLSETGGGLADPEVINVLLETASAPYIRSVRRRAIEAVVNMRSHANGEGEEG